MVVTHNTHTHTHTHTHIHTHPQQFLWHDIFLSALSTLETLGSPVFLGSLTTNSHGVQGNVFTFSERTLMLTEFFYDGSAPGLQNECSLY